VSREDGGAAVAATDSHCTPADSERILRERALTFSALRLHFTSVYYANLAISIPLLRQVVDLLRATPPPPKWQHYQLL
jgi:hypothetical protein